MDAGEFAGLRAGRRDSGPRRMGEHCGLRAIRGNSERARIREEPGADSLPAAEEIFMVAERVYGIPGSPEAQASGLRVFLHPH